MTENPVISERQSHTGMFFFWINCLYLVMEFWYFGENSCSFMLLGIGKFTQFFFFFLLQYLANKTTTLAACGGDSDRLCNFSRS